MADIAKLGVEVDAKGAIDSLNKVEKGLQDVGKAAPAALTKLDKQSQKTGKSMGTLGAKAKQAGKGFGSLSNDMFGVADGFGLMEGKMGRFINRARGLVSGLTGLTRGFGGIKAGMAGTAAASSAASTSMAVQGVAAGGAAAGNVALGASAAAATPPVAALGAAVTAATLPLYAILAVIALVVAAFAVLAAGAVAAFATIGGLYKAFSTGSPIAAGLEDARLQLAFMMGDMDKAEARMTDLVQFSNETPFSPTEVIEADKLLYSAGKGDLANNENLKLIGAAAKIANKPLIEVTSTFSRLYASLKLGKPDGEALRRLMIEIPVLSQGAGVELKKLSAAGADQATMWKVVTDDLRKYENMLMASSQTFNGMISTVKGKWDFLLAEFAKPINNALKPLLLDLQNMIDFLLPYAQRLGVEIANAIKALYQIGKDDGVSGLIEYTKLGLSAAAELFGREFIILGGAAVDTLVVFMIRGFKSAIMTFFSTFGQGWNPMRDFLTEIFKTIAINFVKMLVNEMSSKIPGLGGSGALKIELSTPDYSKLKKELQFITQTGAEGDKSLGQVFSDSQRSKREEYNENKTQPFGGIPGLGDMFGGAFGADQSPIGKFQSAGQDALAKWQKDNAWTENVEGITPMVPGQDTGVDAAAAGAGKKVNTDKEVSNTEQLLDNWGDIEGQLDQLASGALQGLADTMVDVITGAKDAGEAFKAFGEMVVKSILKIIVQLLIELAVRTAIAALTGGGSAGVGAAASGSGLGKLLGGGGGGGGAAVAHSGGIVGQTATRSTSPGEGSGSQRYHSGGLVRRYHTGGIVQRTPAGTHMGTRRYHSGGSASSEVPAILEKGEQVLSRGDKRKMRDQLEAKSEPAQQARQEVKIINVIDPREVQREIASNPGLILNVVSRNRKAFRQAIGG